MKICCKCDNETQNGWQAGRVSPRVRTDHFIVSLSQEWSDETRETVAQPRLGELMAIVFFGGHEFESD